LEKGFGGRSAGDIPAELRQAVVSAWSSGVGASSVTLGLRIRHAPAVKEALALVADEKANRATRLECIRILGEIDQPGAVGILLKVLRESKVGVVRQEVLGALQRYGDAQVAETVLALYPGKLPEADGVRSAAHNLLASRPAWSLALLRRVDAGTINPRAIPQDVVQKLGLHADKEVVRLVGKHFGRVRGSTPEAKQREILRIGRILKSGTGDAPAGKEVFKTTCGKCHKLFGEGGEVGPELTGYERTNAMYWMENIVDPSAVIREEYVAFVIDTTDGRKLQGIVAAQDKTTVTLRDQEGRTTRLARSRIEEMRASPMSLMPEDQLKPLSDKQVRDLFAYLMSKEGR
jgi:putative heme-binding domain-containing protein